MDLWKHQKWYQVPWRSKHPLLTGHIHRACESGRGRPYDFKIRELVYIFRQHNIGIEHVEPIVNAVLSLVNLKVKKCHQKV